MTLIPITNKLSDKVERAVDAVFDSLCDKIALDEKYLAAALAIDNAQPIYTPDGKLCYFTTPFGTARLQDLSSGLKSIFLIFYRLEHTEINWIPSIDSMGPHAKGYILDYLSRLPSAKIPFELFCTAADLPREYRDMKIFISDQHNTPTTLQDLLEVYT